VADNLASKERRDEDAMLARNGAGAGRGGESRLGFAVRGGNGADALRRNLVDSALPGSARPVVGEESRSTSGDVDRPLAGTELNLAMANDSPGVAMTGCVSALAAAQLAEEGRDDEARRVACQSANVLQNAAGLNGNFYGAANAGNTGEWQAGANGVNVRANAQVLSVEAAAAQLCGTLNGKATEEQRKAAIERARAAATAGYLENRKWALMSRKLAPELLARVVSVETTAARQQAVRPAFLAVSPLAAAESPGAEKTAEDAGVYRTSGVETVAGASANGATGAGGRGAPVKEGLTAGDRSEKARLESDGVLVSILVDDTTSRTLDVLRGLGARIEVVKAEASLVVAWVPTARLEDVAMIEAVKRVEMVAE
jgi:hypothetical protein